MLSIKMNSGVFLFKMTKHYSSFLFWRVRWQAQLANDLQKSQDYREAYNKFDTQKVAKFDDAKQYNPLQDQGIVPNRLKVAASVTNAKEFLEAQKEFGSFNKYVWGFIGGKALKNKWKSMDQIPVTTKESNAISKD